MANQITVIAAKRAAGKTWHGAVLLGVAFVALGAGCGTGGLAPPAREEVLRRILPSSVQVVLEQREGSRFRTSSGVVIASRPSANGSECFILTSGHTLARMAEPKDINVVFGRHEGNGEKVPATVLAWRETDDLDIALLSATSRRCVPARTGWTPVLGESIWVVAFPWGRSMTLASGVVSQLRAEAGADRDSASRLMIDASVSYGSSGGGVYEARTGALIGVVEGYRTARISPQGSSTQWYIDVPVPGQTFVTPLSDILRFLAENGHGDLVDTPRAAERGLPANRR